MKKLFSFFALFAFVSVLISCSSENPSDREDPKKPTEKIGDKTLSDLEEFNSENFHVARQSRGLGGNGRTIGRVLMADLGGAIRSLSNNGSLVMSSAYLMSSGTPGAWLGGSIIVGIALYGGAPASYRAYKKTCSYGCTIEEMTSLYQSTVARCEEMAVLDSLGITHIDLIKPQLQLPDSMKFLANVGYEHNLILNSKLNNGETMPLATRANIVPEITGEYTTANNVFESEELYESFSTIWNHADIYTTASDGFDFESYVEDMPFSSTNVNDAIQLFVSAYDTSVDSFSDLVNVVNNYISIIEADNEFTATDRIQIYTGLVVAVYSYSLWENYMTSHPSIGM